MLKTLETWICDTCGGIIKSAADGYVVWKTTEEQKAHGFRVIHQKRCEPKGDYGSSAALSDFLGIDGAARLLSFLTFGPLKQYPGKPDFCRALDLGEFVDLFRRLQAPFYETARKAFQSEAVREDFSDSNEYVPYTLDCLKALSESLRGKA